MSKNKTIIIAEAGVNHNGNIKIAKKLVDVAKISGADYVKFQTFKTKNFVMTLFNLNEAKKILKDFKIIHYEIHKTKIPKSKYNFEKFTFYCI